MNDLNRSVMVLPGRLLVKEMVAFVAWNGKVEEWGV